MKLSIVTDEEVVGKRTLYQPLFETLLKLQDAGSNDWVRVSLDDVSGPDNQAKQGSLWQAAKVRKVKIQTKILEPNIHVRISQKEKHRGGAA